MIRKAIIVVLTLGAVGMAVLMTRSLFLPSLSLRCYPRGCSICYGGGIDLSPGPTLALDLGPGLVLFELNTMTLAISRMIIPLWVPFVLFAAYPTIAFIRGPLRRWRRRRKGLCIRCGYNLEGNVSGVCPECGEAR